MCGYAVDIEGAMVSGVIVGKEKARAVFEEEVREHKSAPAIAEQVAGNMFQTRIHPFKSKVLVLFFFKKKLYNEKPVFKFKLRIHDEFE